MLNKLRFAIALVHHFGLRWAFFRLRYAARLRLGMLRRVAPLQSWGDIPVAHCTPQWPTLPPFPAEITAHGVNACVAEADRITMGEFAFFSHHRFDLGMPPNWHRNPFGGQTAPADIHFSELGDFDFGDIKGFWELSRFGWAYSLARAYARTHNTQYAETFWCLFEDWCAHNPPNAGVNWKCGQEATFRLMAANFAVAQFPTDPASTAPRRELFARFVLQTGRRIAANIDYALSQSNNHGISESIGLLTAGLMLGELSEAAAWRASGLKNLHAQLNVSVYSDGGFSQHSLVYHRVLVHDLLWAIVVLRAAGSIVPQWLLDKTRSALDFLSMFVDPETGAAPLWGSNDGSNILPLDDCAYDDYCGVLQGGYAVLDGVRVIGNGPQNETAYWLTGRDPATLPRRELQPPAEWHAAESGCYLRRSGDLRLFMFCPTEYRHRIVEADMLHVDAWWRGQSIMHDAGTYSYNAAGRFASAFQKAVAHSVPMLADEEPLHKVGRFLYLPWPRGTFDVSDDQQSIVATHTAYGARMKIARAIHTPRLDEFVITDRIGVPAPSAVHLHWLLADRTWQLDAAAGTLSSLFDGVRVTLRWECSVPPRSVTIVRADEHSARGWWSPHYLAAEPAVSLALLFDVSNVLEVATRITVEPA